MSGLVLCAPFARGRIAAVSTGDDTAVNLLTRDPKEAWVAAAGSVSATYDFGSAQSWDNVFLGFTTAAAGSTWSVTAGNTADASDVAVLGARPIVEPFVAPGEAGRASRRVHLHAALAVPQISRFVRVTVTQPAGATAFRASVLIVNAGFRPTWPQELGSGRTVIDTGARERLLGGGFGVNEGSVKDAYQWTLGDLSNGEIAMLYGLVKGRGETCPLLVAEDAVETAGLQERLHYGVFDRLEAYERNQPGKSRWSLRMEEWL